VPDRYFFAHIAAIGTPRRALRLTLRLATSMKPVKKKMGRYDPHCSLPFYRYLSIKNHIIRHVDIIFHVILILPETL